MEEELTVVLNRRNDPSTGLGFSLLDKPGFPPVIYDIEENSPAAESGKVEAGDVILKINDIDVAKFSIREVLKCLRLAGSPVVLKLKRDPTLKEKILLYLSSATEEDEEEEENVENDSISGGPDEIALTNGNGMLHAARRSNARSRRMEVATSQPYFTPLQDVTCSRKFENETASSVKKSIGATAAATAVVNTTTSSIGAASATQQQQQPMFEAYVMTGERLLKLTKNPSLLPKYQKKIDSLKSQNCRRNARNQNYNKIKSTPSSPVESSTLSDNFAETKSSSTNTSPVTVGAPLAEVANSSTVVLTSSTTMTATAADHTIAAAIACNSPFLANVSKSDEHIQYRKTTSVSSISVQVDDDDLTSSLHTLLDTRSDSSNNKAEDKRVLWTYNAPSHPVAQAGSTSTIASSENVSQPSISPPSPTSVSSSVMSSMSSSSSSSCSSSSSSSSSTTTTADRKRPQMVNSSSNNYNCNNNNNNNSHRRNYRKNNNSSSIDSSQLEASNISSPDYQEETSDLLNSHDMGMEVTDPSDSDSTLLVSEPKIRKLNKRVGVSDDSHELNGASKYLDVGTATTTVAATTTDEKSNHRIIIQVKGIEKDKSNNFCDMNYVIDIGNGSLSNLRRYNNLKEEEEEDEESENNVDPKKVGYEALSECDDELIALTEGAINLAKSISPPHSGSSEEESGSDVESLHSFHYSPKGVDYPSAHRLAKRLFYLDGFKKSDVSRHLSKNNEFNRAVAEEYLKHFSFVNESLEEALRKFLKQFSLSGESQERERVLVHFSKRYLDCNPGSFNSQDAVHTLTCAIMLLNNDLHDQNIRRKMTCNAFIENLSGLNDGENFPRDILKSLYQAIKNNPLEWAVDDEIDENAIANNLPIHGHLEQSDGQSEFILPSDDVLFTKVNESNSDSETSVIDYKKGYVLRKCCYETNGKRTAFGKRGWKLMFCTLRDLVLYLHKDDQELNRNQTTDTTSHNVIRLHHALATKASDYTKKQFVFRLQTADRAEYLFQTSDNKELQSWVDTINLVCASFSAPALPEPVGSQKKFQRPLLPSAPSKLNLRDQLKEHERMVEGLEKELDTHRKYLPEKSAKNLVTQNYKEKEAYLCYEVRRYKTYVYLLQSKLPQMVNSITPVPLADIESEEETAALSSTATATLEETEESSQPQPPMSINRYSYRAAIYSNGGDSSGGVG